MTAFEGMPVIEFSPDGKTLLTCDWDGGRSLLSTSRVRGSYGAINGAMSAMTIKTTMMPAPKIAV